MKKITTEKNKDNEKVLSTEEWIRDSKEALAKLSKSELEAIDRARDIVKAQLRPAISIELNKIKKVEILKKNGFTIPIEVRRFFMHCYLKKKGILDGNLSYSDVLDYGMASMCAEKNLLPKVYERDVEVYDITDEKDGKDRTQRILNGADVTFY